MHFLKIDEYIIRQTRKIWIAKTREDNDGIQRPLNKAGVLKHISELIETLDKINKKLSRVFDYHEAMGIDLKRENNQTALSKAKNKRDQLDFVPLRTIYTSLFSTGLHLQNSLLRVRQLEKIFDLMEKVWSLNIKQSIQFSCPSICLVTWEVKLCTQHNVYSFELMPARHDYQR